MQDLNSDQLYYLYRCKLQEETIKKQNEEDEEKSKEIKSKLHGMPYLWKDVYYCIFNNADTFPESISFLCRIKVRDFDGGLVYSTNPDRRTYKERYFDNKKELDFCYKDAKRKILNRTGINLGFEGRILNDAKNS